MKKIITALLLLCLTTGIKAQNAQRTKDGNFVALTATPKGKDAGKDTGKTFTDRDGKKYPVFESAKGKLYYIRTSKNGNEYRAYIRTETK